MNYENIGQMIMEKIEDYSNNTALRFKKDDTWQPLTYAEFGKKINQLTCALIQAGVKRGDNVAIYSANRYEWAVSDFACIFAGAVSVPIYATSTKEQAEFIIKDAGIKFIFIGDEVQYKNIEAIKSEGTGLEAVTYDPKIEIDKSFTTNFDEFITIDNCESFDSEIKERLSKIQKDDTTTIIYTSGTTGDPKGVMLTHTNLFHQLAAVDADFDVSNKDSSLCFLPLSHVYERMWSYYVYYKGATHTYLEDPRKVIETMQEIKPTALVSVPRLYEKIYAAVMNSQEEASSIKKKLFQNAIAVGHDYYTKTRKNETVSTGLKAKHKLYDKLVLSKIRKVVGGDKNFFSAGGAPLEKEIEQFFFDCGLLICQGYGLTETSPMVSANTPLSFKFGTVGKPVPGCEVRIGENGEVQVKGPLVMKGYYNNPKATAEVMDGEWFKTGDVGEFDDEGYLRITGRIKEIIITSGGKNIAPLRIETLVGKDFFIEQIIAIGDKRNFISALVVPSFEGLESWAKKKEILYHSIEDLVNHPAVISFYEKRIELQSKLLAQYETIKKFKLLHKPFTIEEGGITPTLKLKRDQIHKKFKDLIDSMYHKHDK
ncbi:MAG: long-chain fatty acid--CoA ligase [Calditrichaeota bacterium]|nr:MAG: long-chain fatty acid--CoA ligase [Calditrichota bacterium]MBL1205772.1 long-chain fatty acid--CoA ligase [Calditrichota bacterium]NOG45600.1 long-chain fatty acid--CoA ligase [Calditrichota bacterium]